jgi:uncharacterized protein (UPF0335 family)
MSDPTIRDYSITADERRQIFERLEKLDADKAEIVDERKGVMAEAKGRGYDGAILNKIVARQGGA